MSSSRQQIDSVIDDEEEFCPLCIEEFDLSDKNFKPCPCGYQICQFCYNNIKTHSEEGRCPNCRRPYDESTIQYKVPDADEFKADLALKHRKAAAAKKKETERREIEASSRKNLAGVRVVQKNLVYVIGLNPTIRDESQLLQTLRGPEYFGQYGEIDKIVVSKAKPGGNPNQGIGVYVTYATRADAATCIAAVDGSPNGDRVLRAQFGTTKYCSSFLRNEQCHNRNCTFLHETGEDSDSYSRQDLSSMNTLSSQRHGHPNPIHPRPLAQVSQQIRRQPSKDDAGLRQQPSDGPALPSSASWANKDAVLSRTRRTSITGSQASQSPRPTNSTALATTEETKRSEKRPQSPPRTSSSNAEPSTPQPTARGAPSAVLENLVKAVNSPDFKFVFSTAGLSAEEIALIENHPSFIDPYGGVKRRAMREKSEQERAKREQELLQSASAEEDNREAGSLQLGGEPDDPHPARGSSNRDRHGAIQPPSQQGTTNNSTVGSPVSAGSQQFQGLNLGGRNLTPLQQQQLMLLKSANNQQTGLVDPLQGALNTTYDQAAQAQNRQSSRFSFANDANTKNLPNTRMLNEQTSGVQSGTINPLTAPTPQQALAGSFYTSGVQGPPPGLKTAGTPPISGGGMFAQGHGFTSNSNLGLGANLGKQENNPELMRELLRGRSGANTSGLQGQEAAKLDEEFPPLGAPPKDKRPVDSFGYLRSNLPSESQGSGRSGTPTLPPGLPLPHAHPASALFQSPLNPSSPSVSPAPGLNATFSRHGTPSRTFQEGSSQHLSPELKGDGDDTPASAKAKNVSEISLGSPVPKSAKRRDHRSDELTTTLDAEDKLEETGERKAAPAPAKGRPRKLDLALDTFQSSPPKVDPAALSSAGQAPAPASATGSRPNTPLTSVSRISDSSAARQPRVLRVVDTLKTETPTPVSASHSTPSVSVLGKAVPRKTSLSSLSRPDTPGDLGSEGDLYASTSASRANSPPASSRIGSAPIRSMTKSQAKKERKQKAKEAEAKTQETVSQPEEPVQAPIIGRKRKTKKTPAIATEPSSASSEPAVENTQQSKGEETTEKPEQKVEKVKQKEKPKKDEKPATVQEKAPADGKKPEEAWRSKNTLEQMLKDSESSGVPIKELFSERTLPLQTLLAQLYKSGGLDLNNHPLFNPPNLNQRFDLKCVSEDFEALKHPIELTEEHRKALLRGEPIRINNNSSNLKDRCLISPHGCVLHHLSREEEDRYLALEKSVSWVADVFQGYPCVSITEPDTTNRGGGLDALFATPENFNVCWVDEASTGLGSGSATGPLSGPETAVSPLASAPLNVLSTMEADSTRSHNWAIANTAELVNATAASVRSFAAATAKHMLGAAGVVMNNIPDLDDVVGMTDEELRSFAVKSQKELESSRKELDSIDKKLAGLMKRNKKLAQQALATEIEI